MNRQHFVPVVPAARSVSGFGLDAGSGSGAGAVPGTLRSPGAARRFARRLLAVSAALAAVASVAAGCGSPCVAKDDRLVVDVLSTGSLNDAGAGPQHVRFQVWGVRDRTMFDNAGAAALAEADGVATFERQGLGRVFVTDSNWIKPASTRRVVLRVDEDSQFTHVGIAVLYPEARKFLIPVDCATHPGYVPGRPEHAVTFTLGTQAIEPGSVR